MRLARAAKAVVSPGRGDLASLTLTERGRALAVWCPDDEVFTLSRELVLDRIYERGGVGLRPGLGTVVDAGAHVGIFSVLASQWAERVVALEASPLNVALLRLNVQRNALANVEPRHCALWSTSSSSLGFSSAGHSGGGAVVAGGPAAGASPEPVQAVSLDDLIAELGPIDLLKMDVEGAEYGAIGACTRLDAVSAIVGEMHLEGPEERPRLDALLDRLAGAGFDCTLVTEAELCSSDRVPRLWRNRKALAGHLLVKALAAAYDLAPLRKPLRPHGATYELPILIAERLHAPGQAPGQAPDPPVDPPVDPELSPASPSGPPGPR